VETSTQMVESGERFALERQLEEFLLENWERTPLAKEWAIFSTSDDPEAGNQYPTDVGRIDILAVHKTQPRFLVVELKRNQSTDQTIGQVLRYVGWVKKHLATDGQSVEALIIAHRVEKEARYALLTLPHIRMMTYEVEFRLTALAPLPE
jgi:Endonuclease NucS C-terminal domain